MIKKSSNTIWTALVVGVLTVLVVAGYVFAQAFLVRTHEALRTEYTQLLALDRAQKAAQGAELLVRHLKDDIDALDQYVLREQNIVAFIQRIESLGGLSGTAVEVIAVEVFPGEGGRSELTLRFQGAGSWGAATQLLALTEALPTKLSIVEMVLKKRENEDVWALDVSLSVPLFE